MQWQYVSAENKISHQGQTDPESASEKDIPYPRFMASFWAHF